MNTYDVLIFPKDYKIRDRGGRPPVYMFSNKRDEACGRFRYAMYGESQEELSEYLKSELEGTEFDFYIYKQLE